MDYKTNLKIALLHLEQAEAYNPKLSAVINEVAKAYKSRPKIRVNQSKQLNIFKVAKKVKNVSR